MYNLIIFDIGIDPETITIMNITITPNISLRICFNLTYILVTCLRICVPY